MKGSGVRAVIWDVDGTMVDRVIKEQEHLQRSIQAAGVEPPPLSFEQLRRIEVQAGHGQRTWRTAADEEAGFIGLAEALLGGPDTADPEHARRLGLRLGAYFDVYVLVPGMRELLDDLQAIGVRQAVVSEWPPSLRAFLRHHDLDRYFESIVVSAEEGVLKPDPSLLAKALGELGLAAGEAVYIGDSVEKDQSAAQVLGVPFLHFDPRRRYKGADLHDVAQLREALFAVIRG